MSMSTSTPMCMWMWIWMYIQMYMHMYMYIFLYVCMYVCMYVCVHVHMFIYVCIYIYICGYIPTYIHICVHTYLPRLLLFEVPSKAAQSRFIVPRQLISNIMPSGFLIIELTCGRKSVKSLALPPRDLPSAHTPNLGQPKPTVPIRSCRLQRQSEETRFLWWRWCEVPLASADHLSPQRHKPVHPQTLTPKVLNPGTLDPNTRKP